jgi:glycosyltransferase involved in cell wall biosynthesis
MVSVIIPNYNHAPFLRQRIDSVLTQSYQNFEVIILDDCSTDNSRDVIELYRNHPKVTQVVYNDANSGSTFRQWQKGILLATAPYIWIAESDDYADPDFLYSTMRAFNNEPALILSYCQSMLVDEDGNQPYGVSEWADALDKKKWKNDYIETSSVELHEYLSFRNTIVNASAVVFRKPSDINILEESLGMKIMGDWLFWRKLLNQNGKIAFCSLPLNFFRFHRQSTRFATTREKELTRMKEYSRMIIYKHLRLFESRYDWMIWEWFTNRKVLKGSIYYYFPNLPLPLILRSIFLIAPKVKNKILAR